MTSEEKNENQETSPVDVVETVTESTSTAPQRDALSESQLAPLSQMLDNSVVDRLEGITQSISNRIQQNPRNSLIIAGSILLILLSLLIEVSVPHVSLAGEPLMIHGPSWFTNSLLTTIIVDIVVLALAYMATKEMSLVPSGLQNVLEAVIEYIYDLAESIAGHDAPKYFSWAATLFFFLIISNWSGIVPFVGSLVLEHPSEGDGHAIIVPDNQLAMTDGVILISNPPAEDEHIKEVPVFRAPSADLSTTFALALATMALVQYYGIRALGASYFKKFWNTSGNSITEKAINIFVGVLEAISEISRILTFAFRLFGNVFAGEVVLATMAFLVAFLVPVPFYALEVLVGAIQAFVFMMLALIFFNMATESHGDEHH